MCERSTVGSTLQFDAWEEHTGNLTGNRGGGVQGLDLIDNPPSMSRLVGFILPLFKGIVKWEFLYGRYGI